MKLTVTIISLSILMSLSGCATWEKSVGALAPMVVPEEQQLFCDGMNQLLTGAPATDLETLLREKPESPWSTRARTALALTDEVQRLNAANAKLTSELVDSRNDLAQAQQKLAAQAALLKRQKRYIQKLKDLIVDSEIEQVK